MKGPALEETTTATGRQRDADQDVASRHARVPAWLSWGLIGAAGLVFIAWLLLAATHANDRYQLDHVSGARIALARYFNQGTLYPELYDGHSYGGTRFMPIPIVLHGFVARLTDEYVLSGKLLSYALMLGLVATTFVVLRRLRCPLPFAVALSALALTTGTGLAGGMNVRGDVLPLLLQVLAVGIVASTDRQAPTIGAGALAAAALLSKLSAVWAPLAIVIWLFARDRRRLFVFVAAFVAVVATLVLLFTALSGGRIIDNVVGLSTSGITEVRSILVTPYRFVHLMVSEMTTAWAVVPLVGLAVWLARKRRISSIWQVSLVCALAVILLVLTDVGTGWNQLIDLAVLVALVIGELVGRLSEDTRQEPAGMLQVGVGLALLWVTLSGLVVTLGPPVQEIARGTVSYDPHPLSALQPTPTSMLSEDPYVPLSLGLEPVVLDPFMLPRLSEEHPAAVPDLIRRIEAHEFDVVVLVEPLEPVDRSWWIEQDFGIDVARAIAHAYTYSGRMQGYHVYEPQQSGSPT